MALSGLERMGRFRPEVSLLMIFLLGSRVRLMHYGCIWHRVKKVFSSGYSSLWSSLWPSRCSSGWDASAPR
jgi:hypothetical protein